MHPMLLHRLRRLGLVPVLLCLVFAPDALAQRGGNCGHYPTAYEQYVHGAFDDAIRLARQCIDHPPPMDDNAIRSVYPLLVQALLEKPDPPEARVVIEQLHTMRPAYEPDIVYDPPRYRQLFSEVVAAMAQPPKPAARPVIDAPLLYLDAREVNIDSEVVVPRVAPQLQRALTLDGFAFTTQVDHADFIVELNAASRPGIERYGRHASLADLTVTVSDPATGLELYKGAVHDVRGTGQDYHDAGLKALSEAAVALRQQHLAAVVDALRR